MKKIFALVLALCMIFALCACGQEEVTQAAQDAAAAVADNAAEIAEAVTEVEASVAESEGKTYTIGICQLVQHNALDAASQGFMDTIQAELGDAVTFDYQNAQGDSTTCSTIVTGFVANGYDLIMANATPALQAAVAATTEIPILGTSVTDYGAALSMDDLDVNAGTGINVSGASDGVDAQLYVDLTLELVPEAKKVSIIYCSAEANSVLQSDNFVAAMAATNPDVECTVYTFADSNDMQAVVTSAVADCDALYIPTDNTAASNMTIVSNICQPAGVPVICGEENMCAAGGLATVSISYYDIGVLAGQQALQILLEGADVATTPIAYSSNPVKEYSAAYAEAIGMTMTDDFVAIEG